MSDRNSLSVCTTTSSFKGFFSGLFFLSLHARSSHHDCHNSYNLQIWCDVVSTHNSYKLQIGCDAVSEQTELRNRCKRKLSQIGHASACFLGQHFPLRTQHVLPYPQGILPYTCWEHVLVKSWQVMYGQPVPACLLVLLSSKMLCMRYASWNAPTSSHAFAQQATGE